jgi:hypothetical protein
MHNYPAIKRTNSNGDDFKLLITHLDEELWDQAMDDQAIRDQYNKVPDLNTALVVYADNKPIACGCFKQHDDITVEIKRMYVENEYRGKGVSKLVLSELETWANELGYKFAVLETGIQFKVARTLYETSGYQIIPNYGQYAGMEESVCMKKELKAASEFKALEGIEYFNFEEDFVEKNIRCIPMIVRFKMDAAGIKLKLAEWSKFNAEERFELALKSCDSEEEAKQYNGFLSGLIKKYTGNGATFLPVAQNPEWADVAKVPESLREKIRKLNYAVREEQWKGLTNLQRFALIKLSREGHESKNLPKALKEFALI